jgi:WD40 repeat protein
VTVHDSVSGKQVGKDFVSPFRTEPVQCYAFSPDGKYVALGGGTGTYRGWSVGTVVVYELATGEMRCVRSGARQGSHTFGRVHRIAFTADGSISVVADKCERDGP